MGDAKLDGPSSGVRDTLVEAGRMMEETAEVLDGFSREVKDGREALYRAESAAASGRALVALADPSITPKDVANQVREKAENLLGNVRQAESSGGTDGGTIAGPAEQLLVALNALRHPDPVEEKAKEEARRYSQSLNPRIQAIKREIEALEGRLSELGDSASGQNTELTERVDGLKGELEAAGTRVDELISDQDAKFTEAQEERRREFASALRTASDELSSAQADFEEKKDEAVTRLAEVRGEIEKTAAELGGSAVAVNYGEEAKEQNRAAFWWTIVTIALLLLAASVPVALGVLEAKQSPESVAGKISIALIIAGVAGYVANLAHHHRERSARARRLQIELNAFGPFIATLNEEDRDDLRSTIVWRFFGPDNTSQEPDDEPKPGRGITRLLNLRKKARDGSPIDGES